MKTSEFSNKFQSATALVLVNDSVSLAQVLQVNPGLVSFMQDGEGLAHIATDNNRFQVLQLLLELGCDPNLQNVSGETCLHIAVFRGYLEIVNLLLKYASKAKILNFEGKSPLDYAEEFNENEIKDLILGYEQIGLESVDFSYSCSFSDELLAQPANLSKTSFEGYQYSTNHSMVLMQGNQEMIETSRICFTEDIFDFLHSIKLQRFFAAFVRNGFDHLELLAMQMNTLMPLDHFVLEKVGVNRHQDRFKILNELRKRKEGVKVLRFTDLETLLRLLKLEEFIGKFESAGLNLKSCVEMINNLKDFEENTLIRCIGMKKIGHRLRILGILKMDLQNQRVCRLL